MDFYCLGALLYELVTGVPPFYHRDRAAMYHMIRTERPRFPSYVPSDLRDLMSRLLDKNPATRLGANGGAAEIRSHPWCQGVPWEEFQLKSVPPPFRPCLYRSNFDPVYTAMPLSEALEDTEDFASFPGFEFPESEGGSGKEDSSMLSDSTKGTEDYLVAERISNSRRMSKDVSGLLQAEVNTSRPKSSAGFLASPRCIGPDPRTVKLSQKGGLSVTLQSENTVKSLTARYSRRTRSKGGN